MQQESRSQFKGLLDSPFYHDIMRLNFQPLDWVHQDWLAPLPSITQAQQLQGATAQHWLSQQLSLSDHQDSQFNDPIKRLIFLPSQNLARLLNVIGLTCFQPQLALLIQKKVKQQLADRVGDNGIKLVQHKLPLLISRFPPQLTVSTPLFDNKAQQLSNFIPYGVRLLQLATEGTQTKWYQLLKYKLPNQDVDVLERVSLTPAELASVRLLIQKIALEIEPKCMTLLK